MPATVAPSASAAAVAAATARGMAAAAAGTSASAAAVARPAAAATGRTARCHHRPAHVQRGPVTLPAIGRPAVIRLPAKSAAIVLSLAAIARPRIAIAESSAVVRIAFEPAVRVWIRIALESAIAIRVSLESPI